MDTFTKLFGSLVSFQIPPPDRVSHMPEPVPGL